MSFQVAPGEIVGFLGPNGAGKSSTLKALMGFVEPCAGECRLFGAPAGSLEAKKRIGYLPEVAMYYPFLTPIETLTLYGELQGFGARAARKEAATLLEVVGLQESAKKLNRTLSKGMLQRVGIAQSLLGSPDLLILDEVTSGLDPVGRKELREILKDRQRQGTTLFFSSHELSEVDMLCDRILILDKGSLIEERGVEALKDQLRRYVLKYHGPAMIMGIPGEGDESEDHVFELRCSTKEDLILALEKVQKSYGQIIDIESREGSLEEYFIDTLERAA